MSNTFLFIFSKDSVEQTIEQIDVIKRLTETYPDDLQFATSADGKIPFAYCQFSHFCPVIPTSYILNPKAFDIPI